MYHVTCEWPLLTSQRNEIDLDLFLLINPGNNEESATANNDFNDNGNDDVG